MGGLLTLISVVANWLLTGLLIDRLDRTG